MKVTRRGVKEKVAELRNQSAFYDYETLRQKIREGTEDEYAKQEIARMRKLSEEADRLESILNGDNELIEVEPDNTHQPSCSGWFTSGDSKMTDEDFCKFEKWARRKYGDGTERCQKCGELIPIQYARTCGKEFVPHKCGRTYEELELMSHLKAPGPKFKVGDRVYWFDGTIIHKEMGVLEVTNVYWSYYPGEEHWRVMAGGQDACEKLFVAADHFDGAGI